MRMTADQKHVLRQMARQFPEFVELVGQWRQDELEKLPYAKDNLGVMQGRVQTLTEMQRHLTGTVE